MKSIGPAKWDDLRPVVARVAASAKSAVGLMAPPAPAIPAARPVVPRAMPGPEPIIATSAPPAVVTAPAAPGAIAFSSEPFSSPLLNTDERRHRLATIDENEVRGCTKCLLCHSRSHTVFGEGNPDARLMFIGEGPGAKEDQTGRPFVGPAGELLNRMIGAMGLKREQVYIANVVKCRAYHPGPPPKDRAPAAEEVAACASYLERQVEIIRPRVIVTLGVPASQFVLQTKLAMSRMRGTWNSWHGIKVMPTWHPSYLLRCEKEGNVEPKRQAWADLQKVMLELGLSPARREG